MKQAVLASTAAVILLLAGWYVTSARRGVGSAGAVALPAATGVADATWTTRQLAEPECEPGVRFERHVLAHTTQASDAPARLFDSNGSGLAADDLDSDGLVDIVLGNLEGPNTILWNEGDWRFTPESMPDRSTRSVQLVDVDADGRLDIVTTHRGAGVAAFRNEGERRFSRMALTGVGAPAYSMAWGDVDADGDLDLLTGSYDAELDQELRGTFLSGDGAGVFVYFREGDRFVGDRLADDAQALVTGLFDLDQDGALDVVVGNDFAMHDRSWRNDGAGNLEPIEPFDRTAAHTMSLDAGDIDADGIEEIFAADMRPASTRTSVLAAWLPLMADMVTLDDPADAQRVRNVLQVSRGDGSFDEAAEAAGLDAAGWAWSSRFGDLDNDTDVDLYIVNGMIAAELFPYLDGSELVESNVVFVNRGNGTFDAEAWGLDSRQSGRGSILVDLDDDGALDVVVNNLASPAVAYENRSCAGRAIEFSLRQPGSGNTHAIGASVTVVVGDRRLVRTVRSGGGYLSGTPSTLHVGLGDRRPERVEIRWPDGSATVIDDPRPGLEYEVVRS